jgi:prepilin-type N-terminal cleavage/methylation domain-containing protein
MGGSEAARVGRLRRRSDAATDAASERGDTLIEVLVALTVLGIAAVALIGAFSTSVTASARHRGLSTLDTVLKSYAESAVYAIQQQPSNPLFASCQTAANYEKEIPYTLPTGYTTGGYSVSVSSVQYWSVGNQSAQPPVQPGFGGTCASGSTTPQLITVTANGPFSTTQNLSFVVDTPGVSTGALGPVPPTITTTSPPVATDGQVSYSYTLGATGGTAPYTWSSTGALPAGLALSNGIITGNVSSTASTKTFTVTVTDHAGLTANASLTITVNPAPNITTTSLPSATKGGTYSQTLAVTGGTAPLTWSVASGSLPATLSLSSAGVISGPVSATATSSTFTVSVTDANGVSDSQQLTVTVVGAPVVTTTTLPAATPGGTYSQPLAATGGVAPYSWQVSAGAPPTGMTLSSSGTLTTGSGAVGAAATTQTFSVVAVDADGVASAPRSLTLTVNPAVDITTTTLPQATKTGTYSQTLVATGGTGTLTWSVTSGALPPNLSLSSSGIISGTVSSTALTQTYAFTVTAVDVNGASDSQALSITVVDAPNITTTTLPAATQTGAYSQALSVSGGVGPFVWSKSAGTLPANLSLSSAGVISGTATAAPASFQFTAQVKDANGVIDTQVLTLVVNAAPTISTTTLPGATQGGAYSQPVSVSGGTAGSTWSLASGVLPGTLSLNASTGVIGGSVAATAVSETFTIKVTDANGVSATKSLTLTVNAPPTIVTSTLPSGTRKQSYTGTLTASGGTTPYTWSIVSGTLPTGLSLNSATGAITGTVNKNATTGPYTITFNVSDANAVNVSKTLTITINP